MAARKPAADPSLRDVLAELADRGLLERVARVQVGNVELVLNPAFVPPPEEPPEKQLKRLQQEMEELAYGSS